MPPIRKIFCYVVEGTKAVLSRPLYPPWRIFYDFLENYRFIHAGVSKPAAAYFLGVITLSFPF